MRREKKKNMAYGKGKEETWERKEAKTPFPDEDP